MQLRDGYWWEWRGINVGMRHENTITDVIVSDMVAGVELVVVAVVMMDAEPATLGMSTSIRRRSVNPSDCLI